MQLKGFHVHILKWCTMHVINLGLLHALNGGALKLVSNPNAAKVALTLLICVLCIIRIYDHDLTIIRYGIVPLYCSHGAYPANTKKFRIMLTRQMGYWGAGSLQDQLDKAYLDFKAWCVLLERFQHLNRDSL